MENIFLCCTYQRIFCVLWLKWVLLGYVHQFTYRRMVFVSPQKGKWTDEGSLRRFFNLCTFYESWRTVRTIKFWSVVPPLMSLVLYFSRQISIKKIRMFISDSEGNLYCVLGEEESENSLKKTHGKWKIIYHITWHAVSDNECTC